MHKAIRCISYPPRQPNLRLATEIMAAKIRSGIKSVATSAAIIIALSCLAATQIPSALAQEGAAQKAFDNARSVAKLGPQAVALDDQAVLQLPTGYAFIPQPQANQLLNAMGNPGKDSRLRGLIMPTEGDSWFVTVRFEPAGYIKDDDAKDWNADDLLKSYREGTEENNKERVRLGVPAIEILGWAEKPAYDAAAHRLVWAMSSKERDDKSNQPQGVNYNTYALGRDGYFSLNLVTILDELATHKPAARTLLAALNFNDGKRYTDFNASTDRVAEYGLAALVAGVAAKKLGMFALIAAFAAKFAKIIFVAVLAFGGGIFKFFKRDKAQPPIRASVAPSFSDKSNTPNTPNTTKPPDLPDFEPTGKLLADAPTVPGPVSNPHKESENRPRV